jgi:hypothetical protein
LIQLAQLNSGLDECELGFAFGLMTWNITTFSTEESDMSTYETPTCTNHSIHIGDAKVSGRISHHEIHSGGLFAAVHLQMGPVTLSIFPNDRVSELAAVLAKLAEELAASPCAAKVQALQD